MKEPQPRSMSEATPDPDENRTFAILLQRLESGELHQQLTDDVRDIVARLQDVEAAQGGTPVGKLTLNISFKCDDGVITIVADKKSVMPKEIRRKTMMWATPNNNLTSRNPHQHELPLRSVPGVTAAPIAV